VPLLDGLDAVTRQAAVLQEAGHRPWPLPERSWLQGQTWEQLLFAHWEVPADALRALLPGSVELDLFEQRAYLGLTPFRVENLRVRGLPPAPLLSSFLELNCRTYVTVGGKPGIWFFSLDASSRFAVEAARRLYKLPYFRARMTGPPSFTSVRAEGDPLVWESTYRAAGTVAPASRRTLEHFLSERYCLYVTDEAGALHRAEIHHPPWPLQDAEATVRRVELPLPLRLDGAPHLMYSARQDVVIWPLERVRLR
jgi:uncharacterized protein YqjF (DUF2071 family)